MAFWIINSNRKVGLGKLLRKIIPTNQMDMLQIFVNDGCVTKIVIRKLEGDELYNLQILWDKNISQSDIHRTIRIIIEKLEIKSDIEMAVLSKQIKQLPTSDPKNTAIDIIDPQEALFNNEKIKKWSVIKNWNEDQNTSEWVKYKDLVPQCKKFDDDWRPLNILAGFDNENTAEQIIEVVLWTPENINKYQKDIELNRNLGNFKLKSGKN